jgi:hypothetical protein
MVGQPPTLPRPAPALFRNILPKIKAKTRIPILLPTKLPAPLKEKDIRLVDCRSETDKYEIMLHYGEPGVGANFAGYLAGKKNGISREGGKEVQLANQISGHFWAKSCGGSCAPSAIEWSQNGVLYTLQLSLSVKSEIVEEEVLKSAANSAIQAGPR